MSEKPKFTPGPWEWGGTPDCIHLQTVHHGKKYVMSFCRKGTRYGQPMFQPNGRGMVKAEDLLLFQVGDPSIVGERAARADGSVYRYDVRGIAAPDAHLILAAPDLYAALADLLSAYAEPDKQICCNGQHCGCQGSTVQQMAEHYARAALAKARGQA